MGLFARTTTSASVYFVSSTPLTVYSIFKLSRGICFAHELISIWFGRSSFFHLMNILILGRSDAVNGYFSSDFI